MIPEAMNEREPSSNMLAVLTIANDRNFGPIIAPWIDVERDSIDWSKLHYGSQSGSMQAAISWAYCLFCDEVPPHDWNYRDPFEAFFSMDRSLQVLVMQAIAARHGFLSLDVQDRPKSNIEEAIDKLTRMSLTKRDPNGLIVVD